MLLKVNNNEIRVIFFVNCKYLSVKKLDFNGFSYLYLH